MKIYAVPVRIDGSILPYVWGHGKYERNLWMCRIKSLHDNNKEEPLPPFGACLLGSINLAEYVDARQGSHGMFSDEGVQIDMQKICDEVVR